MKYYGSISLHSLGVLFPSYTRAELQSVYDKYGTENKVDYNNLPVNEIPEYDLNIILTDFHEFDHFNQLISSSFGILLFRIYNTLTSDVVWLGKTFAKFNLTIKNGRAPLTKWLEEYGLEDLRNVSTGKEDAVKSARYIEIFVLPGIKNLETMLLLLTSQEVPDAFVGYTVQDLCELLNKSNYYLRWRTDIDFDFNTPKDLGPKWVSYLNPESVIMRKDQMFPSHSNILELLAYTGELQILTRNRANNEVMTRWMEKRAPKYLRPYIMHYARIFEAEYISIRRYLSSFLDAPIDITCGFKMGMRHVLENEWPFFLPVEQSKLTAPILIAAGKKRLQSSIAGFATIMQHGMLFGPDSNWRKEQTKKGELNLNQHLLKIEYSFMNAIERKLKLKYLLQDDDNNFKPLDLSDLVMMSEAKDNYIIEGTYLKTLNTEPFFPFITAAFYPSMVDVALKVLAGQLIPSMNYKAGKMWNSYKDFIPTEYTRESIEIQKRVVETMYSDNYLGNRFYGVELLWYKTVSFRN